MPRGEHFTREHQQRARKAVSSASCASNGKKGAAVTLQRYGKEHLFCKWQMWKLNNPSMNELVVIGILSRLGFDQQYEREARVASSLMTVDFFFPEKRKAIEVNGRIHQVFDAEQRLARQHQKLALLESERIQCLQIEYLEFCDVRQVISKIREFLQ